MGSNHRPRLYQRRALPLSQSPKILAYFNIQEKREQHLPKEKPRLREVLSTRQLAGKHFDQTEHAVETKRFNFPSPRHAGRKD